MAKIGVFDSGYGGLTILRAIREVLPDYDYIYLGDNARAPYGTHSFDVIYRYTLQAVRFLLEQDCTLVILACNTASAKALRTIQQKDLPLINARRPENQKVNVLGVIRPTVEAVPAMTKNGHLNLIVSGNMKNAGLSEMSFSNALLSIDFAEDSTLVTSFISDRYLPGLLIGYTESVTPNEDGLTQNGLVRTAVDFTNIHEVLIIKTLRDEYNSGEGAAP